MKLFAVLFTALLFGCSTAPYHGEYTRGGKPASYKDDRAECREVAKKKSTEEFFGEAWSSPWWQSVQKNTKACMDERGYEWVKKE